MKLKNLKLVLIDHYTLSSSDENPKYELDLTSFKHFAHLWIAFLVKLTRNGIKIIDRNPKRKIENNATK